MNLSIRGHLMTLQVKAIKFENPDHFFVILGPREIYGLEYIEFNMSELTGASHFDKACNELMEKFK